MIEVWVHCGRMSEACIWDNDVEFGLTSLKSCFSWDLREIIGSKLCVSRVVLPSSLYLYQHADIYFAILILIVVFGVDFQKPIDFNFCYMLSSSSVFSRCTMATSKSYVLVSCDELWQPEQVPAFSRVYQEQVVKNEDNDLWRRCKWDIWWIRRTCTYYPQGTFTRLCEIMIWCVDGGKFIGSYHGTSRVEQGESFISWLEPASS